MTRLVIRPARAGEAHFVAEVHEKTAQAAYADIFPGQPFPREESVERWQAFQGRLLVAEEDGTMVGFVAFDRSELHALYVLPGYQCKGLGSRLLDAAGDVTSLWVLKENRAARSFYEARGWRADGTEQTSYGATEMLYYRPVQQEP